MMNASNTRNNEVDEKGINVGEVGQDRSEEA